MNKCRNCEYERQPDDESTFNPSTECPKCHAIYENVERLLLKKEYEKAEDWLREKDRAQRQDENLSDPRSPEDNPSSSMKNCPYCSEEIKPDAVKCRYCGEWLNKQTAKQTLSAVKSEPSDNLSFADQILSKWERMSWGLKGLTVFLIFLFLIFFVAGIVPVMNDNNRAVSQQQVPQTQGVEQQAAQTQARIEAQEAQSRELLDRCKMSCSRGFSVDAILDERNEAMRCRNRCEQDALTRKIEIEKLQEMQKQR